MAKVDVGTQVAYTVAADYIAEVGADFDFRAVDDEVLAELNSLAPVGIEVKRDGRVFADEGLEETARGLDWRPLLQRIDVDAILSRHGR
ncbi:hypothetical protein ACFSBZ_00590 [Amnibacterium flavum]|uniref:Uncharacterized protein n=1 Tax=Amnibacterium flavum TaxID=2173173 RepID=A0A2V1HTC7_9MICO|nr:hypothetical protein [Amnibacterium flavum]PVZ93577.1 hypothetical protein DDQ50_14795 [Amnibacterium flavum]